MKRVRILQVVGSMNRGGIETWLMSVLRRIDRELFSIDFLVSNASRSPFAEEIERYGSKIIVCPAHSQPRRYVRNLRRVLRSEEPYDVVHSHLHHLNGLVALVARHARVPVRIAHSHFSVSGKLPGENGFSRLRYRIAKLLMDRYATNMVAASSLAGAALFGKAWERRGQVLLCGIDLTCFRETPNRASVRSELGLPPDAIVIGHAGRFVPLKNHAFLLDIAAVMVKRDPRFHFVLLGDGPLWSELVRRVEGDRLLGANVHFLGARSDVPRIMLGAMDAFLFPSHSEGAPLALVEAQAAGLPCVYSDVFAAETDLVPELLCRSSLYATAAAWADALVNLIQSCSDSTRRSALARVEATPYNLTKSIQDLEDFYLNALAIQRESQAALAN